MTETAKSETCSSWRLTCACQFYHGRAHKHDSGWAWVVVVCGCLCNVLMLGCGYSFGVLFPSLLDEFQESKAKTAWIGSLCISLMFFFGPLTGKLCDRFGARMVTIFGALVAAIGLFSTSQSQSLLVIYLTYSTIFAFGSCCVYTAVFLIVPKYFRRWQSLATGIIASGPGSGVFVMSPIIGISVENLGWRGAFIVMASIVLIVCALGCTFDPNVPQSASLRKVCTHNRSIKKIPKLWRNDDYVLMVFVTTIATIGNSIPNIHMARYCEDKGLTLNQASTIYLVMGLCSMVSRIAAGRLSDVKWVNRKFVYQVCLLANGISTLLCPLANRFFTLLMYFIAFGLFDGGQGAVANILVLNSLHERQQARGFGIWLCFLSITIAAAPPFGGYMADSTGSYALAFYIAGAILILCSCVHFMISLFIRTKRKLEEIDSTNDLIIIEKETVL